MADRVYSLVKQITNWHAEKLDDYTPPFLAKRTKRYGGKAREHVLSDDEIRAIWACEDDPTFSNFVKFALLCGQRKQTILAARWQDISPSGVWTIPDRGDCAKGTVGKVQLSELALSIVRSQLRIPGKDLIFAAVHGKGAYGAFSRAKKRLDEASGVTAWRVHDLLRSARTLMSRAGVDKDHAEYALGHVIGGVRGAYDRHKYFDEKSAALAALAAEIEKIVAAPLPDKVVALKR